MSPSEIAKLVSSLLSSFEGDAAQLQRAIGFLYFCNEFGWRPCVVIHTKVTIRSYEAVLGLSIREVFPEFTKSSGRSVGYLAAMESGSFWRVVSGDIKVPNRGLISSR